MRGGGGFLIHLPLDNPGAVPPAPAPAPPPIIAPLPPPAMAPMIPPRAAPPPTNSPVRLFLPIPFLPCSRISVVFTRYWRPLMETDFNASTRSAAPRIRPAAETDLTTS